MTVNDNMWHSCPPFGPRSQPWFRTSSGYWSLRRVVKAEVEAAVSKHQCSTRADCLNRHPSAVDWSVSIVPVSSSMPANTDLFSGFEPAYELSERSMMKRLSPSVFGNLKTKCCIFMFARCGRLNALRTTFKVQDLKISVNDFVERKATATALHTVKGLNSMDATGIRHYESVDLGWLFRFQMAWLRLWFALHTLRVGKHLCFYERPCPPGPWGENCPPKSFRGTFTVSSLGMFGIREFSAIVNPPQAGILAAGAMQEVPVCKMGDCASKENDPYAFVDHRVVDGVLAATFLNKIKSYLETPALMLL